MSFWNCSSPEQDKRDIEAVMRGQKGARYLGHSCGNDSEINWQFAGTDKDADALWKRLPCFKSVGYIPPWLQSDPTCKSYTMFRYK